MFVRCTVLAEGPGPSEMVVKVKTIDGHNEQVLLSRRSIQDEYIRVGSALSRENGNVLIELPRETSSGRWRIWVPESDTREEITAEAAE